MDSKIVFPDTAVRDGVNQMPNVEDNHKKGAFSGVIPILCEVAYNREVALMVRFMARILKITIEESVEFLEKQLKNTRTASQRERIYSNPK